MSFDDPRLSLSVLHCLSDSEWRSGEAVAKQLGISRAAVWKRISRLSELGVEVDRSKRRGYRLPRAFELLDVIRIKSQVRELISWQPEIFVSVFSASTNTELLGQLRRDEVKPPVVVLAEMQTAGRGRRGRAWRSPFARNIYLSFGWRCDGGVALLAGLSLAVGVIVADAVGAMTGLAPKLKWPNDLMLDSKKCGGVLIDVDGDLEGSVDVVIGVGLNIDMSGVDTQDIDQPWTDLNSHVQAPLSRNEMASRLIAELCSGIARFRESGFPAFRDNWLARDFLIGRDVNAVGLGQTLTGRVVGLSSAGGLLISSSAGTVELNSGDVSLRFQ